MAELVDVFAVYYMHRALGPGEGPDREGDLLGLCKTEGSALKIAKGRGTWGSNGKVVKSKAAIFNGKYHLVSSEGYELK